MKINTLSLKQDKIILKYNDLKCTCKCTKVHFLKVCEETFFECALFKYTQVAFYVIYSKLSASTSAHSVQLSTVLFHKGLLADDRSLQPHKLPKPW